MTFGPRWVFLLVGLAYALLVWSSAWTQSITSDEVAHLAAGYSYVRTGDYRMNREHPPLVKIAGGLAIAPLNPVLPLDHPSWAAGDQWYFGAAFLDRNVGRVEQIVGWSRLPPALLAGLMVAIAGLWAFEAWGLPAAALTMVLLGALPEVLSHGRWLTTDVPSGALGLLGLYLAWHWWERPGRRRAAGVGLAFGAALGAKFSMVIWPAMLAIMALARHWDGSPRPGRHAILILALWLVLGPALVLAVCYQHPWGLGWYFHDIPTVNANHQPDYLRYLVGDFSYERHAGYLPIAFVLKTPLAPLVAMAVGVAAAVVALVGRVPSSSGAGLRAGGSTNRAFVATCLGAGLIAFATMIAGADDMGVRYLLPALPFLAILAGRLAALSRRTAERTGVAALVAGSIWAADRSWADLGGAFNEWVPEPHWKWLDDSNLDWGQGLIALRDHMRRTGVARIGFGSPYGVDPRWYGIPSERLRPHAWVRLRPGWYAFSPQFLLRTPGFLWLLHERPATRLSGLLVFDLRGDPDHSARRAYERLASSGGLGDPWSRFHYAAFETVAGNFGTAERTLDDVLDAWPWLVQAREIRSWIRCETGDRAGCEADRRELARQMGELRKPT